MDPIEKVRELNLNKAAWVQSSIKMNTVTEEVSIQKCLALALQTNRIIKKPKAFSLDKG